MSGKHSISRLLKKLHKQADIAIATQSYDLTPGLRDLLTELKWARPRVKTIVFGGFRFPVKRTMFSSTVLCPVTQRQLASRVDL